jgi:O-antigen/teichoic acid export membrane protein
MREARWLRVVNILLLRGLGSGLAVLLTVLVTRYLSTKEAAQFLLVFNITTVAAVCFRWGLDDIILRRVASTTDNFERELLTIRLMRLAHKRVFAWSLFAALTFSLATLFRVAEMERLGSLDLTIALCSSSLIALTACAGRVVQAKGRTNLAALVLNILVPGLLLAGLLTLVTVDVAVEATQLTLTYAFVCVVAYLAVVWVPVSNRPLRGAPAVPSSAQESSVIDRKAANRLGGIVVAQQALNWGALLIIPAAYGDQLFTSFMVTYKVSMLISLVMLAVNFTFSARIVGHFSRGEFIELQNLIRLMLTAVGGTSAATGVLVVVARDWIYSFSNVPIRLDVVLAVLVSSQVFFSLAAVCALVLSMCRDEVFLLKAQGGIALVGILLFAALSFTTSLDVAVGALAATYLALAWILQRRVRRIAGFR